MARAQRRIKKFVGTQTFVDNDRKVFDLPRDFDYESIHVRIYGTTTLSSAGIAVRDEAPLQIAKFVNLKANGTDLLDGVSGIMAHRAGIFRRGQLAPLTAQSDATAAARTFSLAFTLDRAVIDGMRGKDGAFPSRGLSTFQLEILCGAAADCFTGTPAGTTAGTIEVSVYQLAEQRGTDGKRALPRVVTKRTQSTLPYATSNTNSQIRLNTGNLTRGLLLRSYGVSAGEPSNAVINNIKVMQGNEVLLDLPAATVRSMNQQDFDVTTLPTGLYVIDFMTMGSIFGKLSDCLDLRNGEEVWLFLDVTGGANVAIDVATLEFMPYNPRYWGMAA